LIIIGERYKIMRHKNGILIWWLYLILTLLGTSSCDFHPYQNKPFSIESV